MLKVFLVSVAALVGTASVASANTHTMMRSHTILMKKKKVAANGRCNGVSYGTGARRCGSKSGGPVGGNSSRN